MKKFVYIIYATVFILASYLGYNKLTTKDIATQIDETFLTMENLSISDDDFSLGNKNAKYHIKYFLDYSCADCRSFNNVVKELTAKYGDELYITYIPLPWIDENSRNMSIAAVAMAYEGRFFEANNKIFTSDVTLTNDDGVKMIDFFGLDQIKLYNYLNAEKTNTTIVNNLNLAKSFNVEGIPTIIVNGNLHPVKQTPKMEDLMLKIREIGDK